jgi:hypothetical protein
VSITRSLAVVRLPLTSFSARQSHRMDQRAPRGGRRVVRLAALPPQLQMSTRRPLIDAAAAPLAEADERSQPLRRHCDVFVRSRAPPRSQTDFDATLAAFCPPSAAQVRIAATVASTDGTSVGAIPFHPTGRDLGNEFPIVVGLADVLDRRK